MISYIFPMEENDALVVTEGKIRALLFKTKGFCWFTNFSKVEIKLFWAENTVFVMRIRFISMLEV